ncbi:MAG: cation:proton antiporter [Gemmatimonadota bacterium]
MHGGTLLADVVVLFGAALFVLLLSRRLRLPAVAGFLLTGALVGPSGLRLIAEVEEVEASAELGVVFLLFIVALELSLPRLRELGRFLLVGGSLQFGLTAGAGWLGATLMGLDPGPALVAGLALGMSSTAIALKVLADRGELRSSHGRVTLGILLFQDLAFVPLLLVVPLLMGAGADSSAGGGLRILGGLVGVAVAFLVGRVVTPALLKQIVESGIRELFVLLALFVCLGGALLTGSLGLSPALGAFLAGLLLADSEYHYHILTETGPFRDVFTSLFFISVGMLLDIRFALEHWAAVLGLAALAIVGKGFVVVVAAALLGLKGRARVLSAAALAQVGEFAFLLLGAGAVAGGGQGPFALLVPAAVLTMLLSPLLIHAVASGWDRVAAGAPAEPQVPAAPAARVMIGGYGVNGENLLRVLRSASVPTVVVEIDGRRAARAQGPHTRVVFGDVTRPDVQVLADVRQVSVVVLALSDPTASVSAVRAVRRLNPDVVIIARAARMAEIAQLTQAGADEVVAEEFETSIEIVARLLRRLHVPGNVVRAQERLLRADRYHMLRRAEGEVGLTDRLARALAAATTETVALSPASPAVGTTLAQLRLRALTGATVVSVVRSGTAEPNPPPEWVFAADDVLFLLGSHEQIQRALDLLEGASSA